MVTAGEILFWLPFIYTGLFLAFTFLKTVSKTADKIIFCPTCASYFFVLIGMFIFNIPPIIISLGLGLTISGLAYKISYRMSEQRIHFFLSMISLTIIAELILYYFLL